eukprot:3801807-Prymnesium_polylepis.2
MPFFSLRPANGNATAKLLGNATAKPHATAKLLAGARRVNEQSLGLVARVACCSRANDLH